MKNQNQRLRPVMLMLRSAIVAIGLLVSSLVESQSDPVRQPEIPQSATSDAASDSAAEPAVIAEAADVIATDAERQVTDTIEAQDEATEPVVPGNRRAADQVFIPSEEISEDKPVPFPIDI